MGFGLPVESWERFLLVMDSGLPIESWERFCCMDSGLPIELWEHFLLVKDLGLPNRVVAGYDTCHCLGAIYCFTAFMHVKLLFVRRHAHALKFPRLACMPNIYCISYVFGD